MSSGITKRRAMLFGIIAVIVAGIGAYGYKSMVPVNGKVPVFGFPANHFMSANPPAASGASEVAVAVAVSSTQLIFSTKVISNQST
jgi:hypothetical protein